MKIIISGKQMELTDSIRSAIEEKLQRLDHYLNPQTEVRVTVRAKKARQTVEVTVIPISGPIIRAEDSEESLYAAIDIVYDKLNSQLRRFKSRLVDKHQYHQSIRFAHVESYDEDEVEESNSRISIDRRKKFDMKPMSAEEAVLQMDLVGHDFYMFRNIDSDDISIVYKRGNGSYGLIEHE